MVTSDLEYPTIQEAAAVAQKLNFEYPEREGVWEALTYIF